ncbi:MAG TPA: lysophospholipid acyltransferase family protein [Candidatus Saccharimonadales bacterium]|jgi:1-acyl-sn-glycerol-3-phosphate acyltransferase|nr:lysophospholipid acyltransferase family protein [Candidatus Saccharimonadales bacterium]
MTARVHPVAGIIAALARAVSGVQVRRVGDKPSGSQSIYFANHTSHLDFVVLWSALPSEVRARTRPVAAKDYWSTGIKLFLAQSVFRAVLVDRKRIASQEAGEIRPHAGAFAVIDQMAEALGETDSLIIFPEGTRGSGETVAPFRSGLFHLAKKRPQVELVPVYLENLNRILPKGEILPVPLVSLLTFGPPLRVGETEDKNAFLERARAAVCDLRRKKEV